MALEGTYVPSPTEWVRDNVQRDGSYLAVASKGGAPEDPSWAANFRAHPVVDLQDKAAKHTYDVRELSGDERADWWQHAVATWGTYADYAANTDREIPLFLLTPQS